MQNEVTMEQNPVVDKSFRFAVRIVNLYKYMIGEHREYVLSKQILRCGTSIGANIAEAQRGQSKADFAAKMNIALKEASETAFGFAFCIKRIICQRNSTEVCTQISMN